MKIIQINAVAEFSSTGRTTSELHTALKAKGIKSWIAAPNVKDSVDTIKIGSKVENLYHSAFSRIVGRQGYASYHATKRLIRRIDQISPDVIHLRNLHANFLNLPLLFEYIHYNQIPIVLTLHDCWPFTGHCCYFIDSKCQRWKSGCGKCPDLHNWNKSIFFDYSRQNLKDKEKFFTGVESLAVIGVSDWVTSFVKDSILKDAKIIKRIYNWIDLDKFKPSLLTEKSNQNPIILGVSQIWNKQKGIFDFIEVARRLPQYSFILVGKIIEKVELPNNIKVAGVTSSIHELIEYYNKANIFFNPSTRETFGKVTAEAIACGTPVVAYNATANPELVTEKSGIVVNEGDINGVIEAITRILKNEGYRDSCREFALQEFSKDLLVEEYIDIYRQLIIHAAK